MTWAEYYEKINDWAVSTAVSKISSLENLGTPDEVVDALNVIGFEDKKGATRLLNRALQTGMKFSGENLVEISDLCSEEGFQKALHQSAAQLTSSDLETMYECFDDEMVLELVQKYHLEAPADMKEEYAEILCPNNTEPIRWRKFYDTYWEWSAEYARARSKALSDFGEEDQVMEVVQELFDEDKESASRFLQQAIRGGVTFDESNLIEISYLCDEETTKQAEKVSGISLDGDEYVEDDDREVGKDDILAALDTANETLQCLNLAQEALDASSNLSVIDMFSKKRVPSVLKYTSLTEAEHLIRIAAAVAEDLNEQIGELLRSKNIQLQTKRLASVTDLCFESELLDCLAHMRIGKAQREIERAGEQVEEIIRELRRL